MICVSIAEPTLEECLTALADIPFAEIRMDMMRPLSARDVSALFSSHNRLIATYRPGKAADQERERLLGAAIDGGAAYVDVEVDSAEAFREAIVARAQKAGCTVICSFHDYAKTPGREELLSRIEECHRSGGRIAKIACMVLSDRDNARLLGLLDSEGRVVVVGMGEKGRITRVLAPLLGSPFTFASLASGRETAEGQMDHDTVLRLMEQVRRATGSHLRAGGERE